MVWRKVEKSDDIYPLEPEREYHGYSKMSRYSAYPGRLVWKAIPRPSVLPHSPKAASYSQPIPIIMYPNTATIARYKLDIIPTNIITDIDTSTAIQIGDIVCA